MPDDYSSDTRTKGAVKVGGSATGGIGTAGGRDRFGVTLEAARIPCIAARSAYDGRCVGGAASTRPIVRRSLLAAVSAAFAAAVVFSGAALADPRGAWLTPGGKSHVEIAPCGDRLCGRIVWLAEPNNEQGRPKRDAENADESLRSRPILGLPLLTGFPQEPEDGVWDDGEIYNPEDGKTYSSELEMNNPNTLKVRGCVWVFCQTQIWERVK